MPLQFTADVLANCRFYYTPADIQNISYTCNRVASGIKFSGHGLCVNGTIDRATGVNDTAYRRKNQTIQGAFTGGGKLLPKVSDCVDAYYICFCIAR